jgi:hypothetical protein
VEDGRGRCGEVTTGKTTCDLLVTTNSAFSIIDEFEFSFRRRKKVEDG